MRKNVRGEERDTTTHLIETRVFTHAGRVTKFSTKTVCKMKLERCETVMTSLSLYLCKSH